MRSRVAPPPRGQRPRLAASARRRGRPRTAPTTEPARPPRVHGPGHVVGRCLRRRRLRLPRRGDSLTLRRVNGGWLEAGEDVLGFAGVGAQAMLSQLGAERRTGGNRGEATRHRRGVGARSLPRAGEHVVGESRDLSACLAQRADSGTEISASSCPRPRPSVRHAAAVAASRNRSTRVSVFERHAVQCPIDGTRSAQRRDLGCLLTFARRLQCLHHCVAGGHELLWAHGEQISHRRCGVIVVGLSSAHHRQPS